MQRLVSVPLSTYSLLTHNLMSFLSYKYSKHPGNPATDSLAARYGAGHATRPPIFALCFGKFIREIGKERKERNFPALYSIQRGSKCAAIHQHEVSGLVGHSRIT